MNTFDKQLSDINNFRKDNDSDVTSALNSLAEEILSLDPFLKKDRYWYSMAKSLFIILSYNFFLKSTAKASEYMLEMLSDTAILSNQIGYFSIFYGSDEVDLPIELTDLRGKALEDSATTLKRCIDKYVMHNRKSDIIRMSANIAAMQNYRAHAEHLVIPSFGGFNSTINKETAPNIIISATNGSGLMYSLTSDGTLGDDDFQSRIDKVIANSNNYSKKISASNQDNFIFFFKDYQTKDFSFKLYIQDIIVDTPNGQRFVRQINAYFVEGKYNDFYQLSVGAGSFNYPMPSITAGELKNPLDQITKTLDNMITALMAGMKYS